MVVKLIGRTTDLCGKTLWEIVGNLKNHGVGRIVKRNMWERYPEPSFFRICKVHTERIEPTPPLRLLRDPSAPPTEVRKVTVFAEKVFRGRRYPQLVELYRASYKPDYRLVPREEEAALWQRVEQTPQRERVIPSTIPFPPLLKHLIMKEMSENGMKGGEEPKLNLIIQAGRDNFYKQQSDKNQRSVEYKPFHQRKFDPLLDKS